MHRKVSVNSIQPRVAFHIETSHLICISNWNQSFDLHSKPYTKLGEKWGFVIRELRTVFGKLGIEITNLLENWELTSLMIK